MDQILPSVRVSASLLVGALAVAGCGAEPPALAVDGVEFAREDLRGLTDDARATLVGVTAVGVGWARDELLRLGQPLLDRLRREALVERLADEITVEAAGAGEDQLRAYYLTNPEYELTVRHIVFLAERWQADSVRARARWNAERALERVRSGEPFAEVAAEMSEEPGAADRGGLLEPGRRGSWVSEFWEAASALDEGAVSDVVRTPYGFHVIKLEKRETVPFSEARPRVVARVAELVGSRRAWRSWADSVVAADVELRSDAVRGWAPAGVEGGLPDSTLLASWPEGGLAAAAFRSFLASLPAGESQGARAGDADAIRALVSRAARQAYLARLARERGLEPQGDGAGGTDRREWQDRVTRWAGALGFGRPMSEEEIRSAALRGLGKSAQGARIARDEIRDWLPLLRAAYPIRSETSARSAS